jgi:photosystem II stability/assembly factor-like uncharacterized protein
MRPQRLRPHPSTGFFAVRPARWLAPLAALLVLGPHALASPELPDSALAGLKARLIGPFRGGWATTAAGVPGEPDTYYFGAAGGGVWKTRDAGHTWRPVFDRSGVSSIGAIAVAPSDGRTLYVGTGQPEARYDVQAGAGVFRSRDGGETWESLGLAATRHIGRILVDPRDSRVLLVGALGHYYGANRERGVYRSSDGGNSFTQTLFVDETTGVIDLAADPKDPDLIFAATWTAQLPPWLGYFQPQVGTGSAVYRSKDGGRSWEKLGGAGWPAGPLGRIGLAVTHLPSSVRIYASVSAEQGSGLYRSDDGGASWQKVNEASWLTSSYMSRITVAPNDPDTLYTAGQSIHRSNDGGKSFAIVRGAPGGDDFHFVWVSPADPTHMIASSDQGAIVTVNGGASWSDWYNQPTGQFYALATDRRFPYSIYSGQQDSGTVAIASRSDTGAIGLRDWHPVGGGERDFDLPDPADASLTYGSDLGGRLVRFDGKTGQLEDISPWPIFGYAKRPTHFRYHTGWFSPLAFAEQAPHTLYAGAQLIFRSEDRGRHWKIASPELNGHAQDARNCEGNPSREEAYACGFGVVTVIAPSVRRGENWAGTDDGRLWLSRDDTNSWRAVTPAGVPHWARIAGIEPSRHRPGAAYLVIDNHRQDDFAPHLYYTDDYGASWRERTEGLKGYLSVVREDPVREGLLYVGGEQGLFLSIDGASFQPLPAGLPPAWVHDLKVKDRDLVIATVGRGLYVLDDLSPLRELTGATLAESVHLFKPATALRLRAHANRDTPPTPETPLAANPPAGAVIDYWLAATAHEPVTLEILDATGAVIRRYASDDKPTPERATRYFSDDWLRAPAVLSPLMGAHRFVWDLRLPRPPGVPTEYDMTGAHALGAVETPEGPLVPPGLYRVRLAARGQVHEAPLTVVNDPRSRARPEELRAGFAFSKMLLAASAQAGGGAERVDAMKRRIEALEAQRLAALASPLAAVKAGVEPLASGEGEATLAFATLADSFASLARDRDLGDGAPSAAERAAAKLLAERLAAAEGRWRVLEAGPIRALEAALAANGLPGLDLRAMDPPPRLEESASIP